MKLLGVCFGVGDGWGEAALWAAKRLERVTGVESLVIHEAPGGFLPCGRHPSWWKCKVWDFVPDDVDAVVVFDADVIARDWLTRSELVSALIAQPLVGALDVDSRSVRSECVAFGLDPARYVNCGFMVGDRRSRELLERAWARGPHFGCWMEQTAINTELHLAGWVKHWPRGWQRFEPANHGPLNWGKLQEDQAARVVHVTGLGRQLGVLKDLQGQVDRAELPTEPFRQAQGGHMEDTEKRV